MTTLAPIRRLATGDALLVAGLALLSLVFGFGLVAVTSEFGGILGPVLMVVLPLLPVLALAVLADPRIGLVAVVATFPVGVTDVPGVQLQLVQVTVVAVAAVVVLRRLAAGTSVLPWAPTMLWPVAFVLWLLVALPSAADQQRALRVVVLFSIGLLFAAVVPAACRTIADVRRFLGVLVAMVAAVALTTPFGFGGVRAAYGGAVVEGRATGIFVEPNQMGTFCATGALVGFGLFFSARTGRGKLAAGFGAGLGTLGLLLSLSRGSWIGFVLGVAVLLVKLPEARRALLALSVPLVLLAALVGAFAPTSPQVEVVGQRLKSISGERNPYDNRPAIWREALREVEVDPLTGQGPGNFPVASARVTSESRTASAEHAHNLLLTWAAEAGLPAVVVAVGCAVRLHLRIRRLARRQHHRRDRAVGAALAAALVGVLGQGLVDYTLHNSVVLTVLFALIGAVFALDHAEPELA